MELFKRLFGRARGGEPEARQTDMEHVASVLAEIRRRAAPCLRLEHGGGGRSRLGGAPQLQGDWPRYAERPLSLVAQLDLAEMRAAGGPEWLPDAGRLLFFYEREHGSWGLETADSGSAVVRYEPGDAEAAAFPADLPDDLRFPERPVRFVRALSYPTEERLELPRRRLSGAASAALEAGEAELEPPEPAHQVGGFPHPVQSDSMELQCATLTQGLSFAAGRGPRPATLDLEGAAADWRLLLQLDTDDAAEMMWGDTGRLYFWIREQDARARDFSRAWCVLQSF